MASKDGGYVVEGGRLVNAHGSAISQVGLRGGLRVWVNIEDGWGPGGCGASGEPALVLRDDRFAIPQDEGYEAFAYAQRFMVSSVAEPRAVQGIWRAVGCEPERIGIALAPEALCADLGEAFDGVAHRHERADALEQGCSVEGAGRAVECLWMIAET